MPVLTFRIAGMLDAEAIAALVNIAYRGEVSRRGWTTEADLLDGLRTTAAEVQQLIAADHSRLLLAMNKDDEVIASVCLEQLADAAHIGMFAVRPEWQGYGIGKQLLTYAESYARQNWVVIKFVMHVITLRHELIAFYQRRGYQRSGVFKTFPVDPDMWQPKVSGLRLEVLQKFI